MKQSITCSAPCAPAGFSRFGKTIPGTQGRYVMSRIPFDRDAVTLPVTRAKWLLENGGFEILRTDFLFIFQRFFAGSDGSSRIVRVFPSAHSIRCFAESRVTKYASARPLIALYNSQGLTSVRKNTAAVESSYTRRNRGSVRSRETSGRQISAITRRALISSGSLLNLCRPRSPANARYANRRARSFDCRSKLECRAAPRSNIRPNRNY